MSKKRELQDRTDIPLKKSLYFDRKYFTHFYTSYIVVELTNGFNGINVIGIIVKYNYEYINILST